MSLFRESVLVRFMFWFCWGLLTKLIDLHYDDGLFRREVAIVAGVVCGVTVGMGMASHTETLIVYAAIIVACLVSGKIDNFGFVMPTLLVLGTLAAVQLTKGVTVQLTFGGALAGALLTTGYVLDEKFNDAMDARASMASSPHWHVRWAYAFLKHRCISVVCEATVVLVGAISLFGILQGALFNAGYYAMHLFGKTLISKRLPSEHRPA